MSKKKKSQRLPDGTGNTDSERLPVAGAPPASEPAAGKKDPATAVSMNSATHGGVNLSAPRKDPATASSMNLGPARSRDEGKLKLNYVDPGVERKLPQPPRVSIGAGDRVRLKKTQEYGDGTVNAGEEGFALNPSSQAACWVVSFFTAGGGKTRVVPEWLLEPVGARKAAH